MENPLVNSYSPQLARWQKLSKPTLTPRTWRLSSSGGRMMQFGRKMLVIWWGEDNEPPNRHHPPTISQAFCQCVWVLVRHTSSRISRLCMFSSWKLIGLKQLVVEYDQNPRSTSGLNRWLGSFQVEGLAVRRLRARVLDFEVKRGGGMAISQPAKYSMVVMIGGSD